MHGPDRTSTTSAHSGATLAVPRLGWGQAKGRQVCIAILEDGNQAATEARWREFRARLREFGWVEGENAAFIARFSQGARGRLPALAAELVRLAPDVIATASTPATRTAMEATSTIPIVFITGNPLSAGLVSNLARPGGNATGQSIMSDELSIKWLRPQKYEQFCTFVKRHFGVQDLIGRIICDLVGLASPSHSAAQITTMDEFLKGRPYFTLGDY
jgi:hypothetical protein